MLLYCVRHGQTNHNAEGRIQGQADAQLSELGCRQGAAAAEALRGLPIEALYSSPLGRAMATAEPIAAALGLPIRTDPRLMELNVGVFQNQLRAKMQEQYPEIMGRWLAGDMDYAIPGGETRRELARRGEAAFRAIYAAGHRRAAVVAHGGLLSTTIRTLVADAPDLRPFSLENGSITVLEFAPGAVRLVSLNQTEHLRDVGSAGSGDL